MGWHREPVVVDDVQVDTLLLEDRVLGHHLVRVRVRVRVRG